jgi:hypothetical protein
MQQQHAANETAAMQQQNTNATDHVDAQLQAVHPRPEVVLGAAAQLQLDVLERVIELETGLAHFDHIGALQVPRLLGGHALALHVVQRLGGQHEPLGFGRGVGVARVPFRVVVVGVVAVVVRCGGL